MKKSIAFLITILCMMSITMYAQSLSDLAKEEKKRREAISNSITIIIESAPVAVADKEVSTGKAENKGASKEKENEPENTQHVNTEEYGDSSEEVASDEHADF